MRLEFIVLMLRGELGLLETRRKRLCLYFAKKTATDKRFASSWFPLRKKSCHNTRNPEKYLVSKSRTERMKKNPVSYMRSELNKLE